jgi:hypothetical protein
MPKPKSKLRFRFLYPERPASLLRQEGLMSNTKIEAWHRRHAIQVAASLPDTTEDALLVLELAKQLVEPS